MNSNGTNSKSRTMGASSSRKVLCESREPSESVRHSKWNLRSFFTNNRLVRNELCEEVQRGVHDKQTDLRDSVSVVQESPEGIQQEDVRPILSLQEDQVQGSGHNSGPTKLFRVGSLRRNY